MKRLAIKLAQLAAGLFGLWLTYGAMLLIIGEDDAPRVLHWLAWIWLIVLGVGFISLIEDLLERKD